MESIPYDKRSGKIWFNGKTVDWADANIHVLNHGLHYASCVFEGERVYDGEIFKLKVTKQSLNRVLRDLIKSKMIKQLQDENDTRKKNLFLDKEGKTFFETVYNTQKKRIFNALKNSNADSVIKFKDVLKKIIDGK